MTVQFCLRGISAAELIFLEHLGICKGERCAVYEGASLREKVALPPYGLKAHDHFIHLYQRANTWGKSSTKHGLKTHSSTFTRHTGLPFAL